MMLMTNEKCEMIDRFVVDDAWYVMTEAECVNATMKANDEVDLESEVDDMDEGFH